MEIRHPRRILAVGAVDSGLLDLITALTGQKSEITSSTLAGSTIGWELTTTYYRARVPIWIDEIPTAPDDAAATWATEFLAPEAREVLEALGALIVVFRKPLDAADVATIRALVTAVGRVATEGCGAPGWDGVCLAVAMPAGQTPCLEMSMEDWEDEVGRDAGFEFVDFEMQGRNDFGEVVGLQRVREALEASDWQGGEGDGAGHLDFLDDDEDDAAATEDFGAFQGDGDVSSGQGFASEAAEVHGDFMGLKAAVSASGTHEDDLESDVDQEREVENLQLMVSKMQAVKDMSSSMPEAERRRFAANAVNDLMKDL